MHPIVIEATPSTPLAVFEPDGNLRLKGRSLIVDVVTFYQPLIEWADQLRVRSVNFTVDFDYFNTASCKKLLELLKTIDDNSYVKNFTVNWLFESDDEDILEKGLIFEERLMKARFMYSASAGA
jgi:SiaC family regulatory phosphoprotein